MSKKENSIIVNSLMVKLGSLITHYEEYTSGNGHDIDKAAIDSLSKDPEIIQWKKQMNALGLLPVKR